MSGDRAVAYSVAPEGEAGGRFVPRCLHPPCKWRQPPQGTLREALEPAHAHTVAAGHNVVVESE